MRAPSALWQWSRYLLLVSVVALVPSLQAQGGKAKRAIEDLERCSEQERKSGCVKILKKKRSGDSAQAIKAQVRGGRIIWYEFDTETGAVRRTN